MESKLQRILSLIVMLLPVFTYNLFGDTTKRSSIDFADWSKGVQRVDAVIFNFKEAEMVPFIKKGKFHPGFVKQKTRSLNESQIAELERCVTNDKKHFGEAGCYWPHHAFVFYGADDQLLGHIEVCLMCGHGYQFPRGGGLTDSEFWDLEGIQALLTQLGMPTFDKPADWDAYFAEIKQVEQGESPKP